MAYFIKTVVTLQTDEGDDLASFEREYKIETLAGIAGVFEHGGKSLILLAEGVEKLGMSGD